MRQVARRLKDGLLELVEVPDPGPGPGSVGVRLSTSIISSGTERATLEVARSGLIAKARARPDQARQVVERARREGVRSTIELVRHRLEELRPLGYSAAGVAIEVGSEVRGIAAGDRIAIAGGGFANHAEVDVVPSLLCARVPVAVADEDAAFATLGAIALNGFRRSDADVGSTVAVIGLGLVGQLAVRIARAAGCRVLGVDLEDELVELAGQAGAEATLRDELDAGSRWRDSADAVLICASSKSNDPVELAASLARERGNVVVVGDVAMDVPRAPFYDKELDLRLARSYGPGRYDPAYEIHGADYPIGFVRWTEQRNMQAFLDLVAAGSLKPSELITHRFAFADAERAFEVLTSERPIAIAFDYPSADGAPSRTVPAAGGAEALAAPRRPQSPRATGKPRFGLIGAGRFATGTIVPGLLEAGFEPVAVASASGLSAVSAQRRFGFATASSEPAELIARQDLDLVVVATQHDSHAQLAAAALSAGRPVYVEKPLALDWDGLAQVRDAQLAAGAPLLVGFNRRWSPLAAELRKLGGPRLMKYRVNAGPLPTTHWTNDLARGGGRLKGEGCHMIDFVCDQVDADPVEVSARGFPSHPELPRGATDNFAIEIAFADRSVASIHYAADAPGGPEKERFEMTAPGVFAVIDDFRRGEIWRGASRHSLGGRRQDKGFARGFEQMARIARGEADPPPVERFYVSTLATLAAARALESGRSEPVVLSEDSRGWP